MKKVIIVIIVSISLLEIFLMKYFDNGSDSFLSLNILNGITPIFHKEVIEEKKEDILLWLEIPKIELMQEVYFIDSPLNDVKYHVEILEESNLKNHIFYLASHSGVGSNAYFNDLIELEKGDIVWISYEGKRFDFIVEEMYYIPKNGYFKVEEDYFGVVYLITCSLVSSKEQLVVKANSFVK